MTAPATIYNTVLLHAGPLGLGVLACRVCGALVVIDPPDYADQHLKWHERHDEAPK
jgi:hypothetical protein